MIGILPCSTSALSVLGLGNINQHDDMKQGSPNEDPIAQRISRNSSVSDVFDVGLINSKQNVPWLAVSPDAIIIGSINSPGGLYQEDGKQHILHEKSMYHLFIVIMDQATVTDLKCGLFCNSCCC